MTVAFDDGIIRLSGNCGLEDVETLLGFLQSQAQPKVDLRKAHHLHGAVLQLLITARARVEHPAEDPFVRQLTVGSAEVPTA
jgi:hypothetical protein